MTRRSNRHDRHDAPLQRRAAARARSIKCRGSAWPGGRALRLQRHAAPTRTAHAAVKALLPLTAVARKRCPARSCMMMSETPLPTLPLGRSAKRALHQASRSAQSARRLRPPHHQEATRALSGGSTHVGARACSATPSAPSAQREAATGLPYRRPGAQRPRHRRRARSARRRLAASGTLRRPGRPGTQARSAVRRVPSA